MQQEAAFHQSFKYLFIFKVKNVPDSEVNDWLEFVPDRWVILSRCPFWAVSQLLVGLNLS